MVGTPEQLHKERHRAGINDSLGLVGGAAGNVGESPGGLELEHGVVGVAEELDQPEFGRGHFSLIQLIDRRRRATWVRCQG